MNADDGREERRSGNAEHMAHAADSMNQVMRPAGIEIAKKMIRSWIEDMLQSTPDLAPRIRPRLWRSQKQSSWETGLNLAPPTLEEMQMVGGFVQQYLCLFHQKNVDLREQRHWLSSNRHLLEDPKRRALFLRMLNELGFLSPVHELYWEVDRDTARQSKKLGWDTGAYIRSKPAGRPPEVYVDLGGGDGTVNGERSALLRTDDVNVMIGDKLYYEVSALLERCIDFDAIAARDRNAALTPALRKTMCQYLYKVLMFNLGETPVPRPPHDRQAFDDLKRDPNSLAAILHRKKNRLLTTRIVPADNGAFDPENRHGAVYPEWDFAPGDPAIVAALTVLSVASSPNDYVLIGSGDGKKDAYEELPVRPENLMIGDFTEHLKALKPDQVDLATGVRSTMYIPDTEYLSVMKKMAETLTESGVYTDDNPRFNFGKAYRIADVAKLQEELETLDPPVYVRVILGPGFERGESAMAVPLSFVMTKSRVELERIEQSFLLDGCRMVEPKSIDTPAWERHFRSWHRKPGRIRNAGNPIRTRRAAGSSS